MGHVITFLARWQHHLFRPSRTQRRGGRSAFVNSGRTDGRIWTGPSPFDAPKHRNEMACVTWRYVQRGTWNVPRDTWRHVMHTIVVPAPWRIEWVWSRPDTTIRSAAIDESAPPVLPLRPVGTESVVAPSVRHGLTNLRPRPVRAHVLQAQPRTGPVKSIINWPMSPARPIDKLI